MYTLITTSDFDKAFKSLDRSVQIMVSKWIHKHLYDCDNPRAFGKGLSGDLKGWWRYRIGIYRLLVEIKDTELIIVAIDINHRSQVYESGDHAFVKKMFHVKHLFYFNFFINFIAIIN